MGKRISKSDLRFDTPDDSYRKEVRDMVEEVCNSYYGRDDITSIILKMLLIDGFKVKDVAAQMGMTSSAVSQRYHRALNDVLIPYFRNNFEPEFISPTSEGVFADYEMEESCAPVPFNGLCVGDFNAYSNKTNNMETIFTTGSAGHKDRITPDYITQLAPNEIFVFGSNLAGMHGGGAARLAWAKFGAKLGVGVGIQGQSYGIPTMQGGVDTIRPYVDDFIRYAHEHPENRFLVTRIGCGIAGFTPEEIAPLFVSAINVDNICLPADFWDIID